MTTAAPPTSAATRTTVYGLIAEHGLAPAPVVLDLVRLGAAAQRERHDKHVSDVGELTRSTALWVPANPPQLQLTAPEVAALGRMAPLIGTPRAAKRLVNLYRLIRAGLPDAAIEKFVAGAQFRPLVIVLAAQVGFPRVASTMLSSLVSGRGDATLTACLDRLDKARADEGERDDRTDCASLVTALRAVCLDEDGRPVAEFDRPASELREWIPRLRRYSFEGALDQV